MKKIAEKSGKLKAGIFRMPCERDNTAISLDCLSISRAWISFFPRKGVSLPTFMNGGELKYLGGIKKKNTFVFNNIKFNYKHKHKHNKICSENICLHE